jgi:hypothetical protein
MQYVRVPICTCTSIYKYHLNLLASSRSASSVTLHSRLHIILINPFLTILSWYLFPLRFRDNCFHSL